MDEQMNNLNERTINRWTSEMLGSECKNCASASTRASAHCDDHNLLRRSVYLRLWVWDCVGEVSTKNYNVIEKKKKKHKWDVYVCDGCAWMELSILNKNKNT